MGISPLEALQYSQRTVFMYFSNKPVNNNRPQGVANHGHGPLDFVMQHFDIKMQWFLTKQVIFLWNIILCREIIITDLSKADGSYYILWKISTELRSQRILIHGIGRIIKLAHCIKYIIKILRIKFISITRNKNVDM